MLKKMDALRAIADKDGIITLADGTKLRLIVSPKTGGTHIVHITNGALLRMSATAIESTHEAWKMAGCPQLTHLGERK